MPTKSKLLTITDAPELREGDWIPLETPGEILKKDFLEPSGVTAYRLSVSIGVPQSYISKVLKGGGISPELSVLLDKYFGLSDGWWSRLQADYDSRLARRKLADKLKAVVPFQAAA